MEKYIKIYANYFQIFKNSHVHDYLWVSGDNDHIWNRVFQELCDNWVFFFLSFQLWGGITGVWYGLGRWGVAQGLQ